MPCTERETLIEIQCNLGSSRMMDNSFRNKPIKIIKRLTNDFVDRSWQNEMIQFIRKLQLICFFFQ